MARATLAEVAAELAGSVEGTDPQERADRLTRRIREEHPDRWKVRSVQNAAARALGVETPSDPGRAAQPGKRRRRRRRVPRIRVAPAASFGTLIAQMLGLVLLFWVIRHAGAVGEIFDRVGSAIRWLVEPVGWGERPS